MNRELITTLFKFPVEEGYSIIVFISHCRGIRFIIFQITSCKADVISVLTPLLSLRILYRYAEPFSKTCSYCSVIQSVWLYNILVLVNYHKRNSSIQKRVNVLKVNVTMTQNRSILPVQYLRSFAMKMLFTSYSKDKREK